MTERDANYAITKRIADMIFNTAMDPKHTEDTSFEKIKEYLLKENIISLCIATESFSMMAELVSALAQLKLIMHPEDVELELLKAEGELN